MCTPFSISGEAAEKEKNSQKASFGFGLRVFMEEESFSISTIVSWKFALCLSVAWPERDRRKLEYRTNIAV